jgi:hypothetical protein
MKVEKVEFSRVLDSAVNDAVGRPWTSLSVFELSLNEGGMVEGTGFEPV